MSSHRPQVTPYEWRKVQIAMFDDKIDNLTAVRNRADDQLKELILLRDSMLKVDLKRPHKLVTTVGKERKAGQNKKGSVAYRKAHSIRMKAVWAKKKAAK